MIPASQCGPFVAASGGMTHPLQFSGRMIWYRVTVAFMGLGALYSLAWLAIDIAVRFFPATQPEIDPAAVVLIQSTGPIQEAIYLAGAVAYLVSYGLLLARQRHVLPVYCFAAVALVVDWVFTAVNGAEALAISGYVALVALGVIFFCLCQAMPVMRGQQARSRGLSGLE